MASICTRFSGLKCNDLPNIRISDTHYIPTFEKKEIWLSHKAGLQPEVYETDNCVFKNDYCSYSDRFSPVYVDSGVTVQ